MNMFVAVNVENVAILNFMLTDTEIKRKRKTHVIVMGVGSHIKGMMSGVNITQQGQLKKITDNDIQNITKREKIMTKEIVKNNWTFFKKFVISDKAPQNQVSEMKLSFYAGAQSVFYELLRISQESETEEQAEYQFKLIEKELENYAKKIGKQTTTH